MTDLYNYFFTFAQPSLLAIKDQGKWKVSFFRCITQSQSKETLFPDSIIITHLKCGGFGAMSTVFFSF